LKVKTIEFQNLKIGDLLKRTVFLKEHKTFTSFFLLLEKREMPPEDIKYSRWYLTKTEKVYKIKLYNLDNSFWNEVVIVDNEQENFDEHHLFESLEIAQNVKSKSRKSHTF